MQSRRSLIMGREYVAVEDDGIKLMVDSKMRFEGKVINIKKVYFKGKDVLLCTSAIY